MSTDAITQLKSGFNAGAYGHSFGSMGNQTCYQDPAGFNQEYAGGENRTELKSVLYRGMVNLKSMNTQTGGAGTAGFAMIPVYVDPKIVDQTRKFTPLVEIIPRVSNMGITADYNNVTSKAAGFFAPEDGSMDDQNDVTDRNSTDIKYLYSVGRTTGQAQASYPSYMLAGFNPSGNGLGASNFTDAGAGNAMQLKILLRTRAIREAEENAIINGDASTNTLEYSGIVKLMGATNTVDKNTGALSLDDMNLSIRYAFDDGGRPSLGVCSSDVYNDVMKLLTAKIGYLQPVEKVFWGFETIVIQTMVGKIPIIPSMFMTNTSGSKALYFLDMSVVEMRVLQDLTFEKLAKTNDTEKFMLKIYEALIIRNPAFCSSVTEIL